MTRRAGAKSFDALQTRLAVLFTSQLLVLLINFSYEGEVTGVLLLSVLLSLRTLLPGP
jgi:hypothetical protein